MRITLTDSPRHIATIPAGRYFHMRVLSGNVLIAKANQDLLDGGGLPVTAADGLLSIVWDNPQVWMQGTPAAQVEVIVP